MPGSRRQRYGLFLGFFAIIISNGLAQTNLSATYFNALRLMGTQHYDQALTILTGVRNDEFGYDAADKVVEIYKIKKDFASATAYFRSLQSQPLTRGIGYFGLARIAYEQKQYGQGIDILKTAVTRGCENINIFKLLCRCFVWGKKLDEMQAYFQELLQHDATNGNYWYGLGQKHHAKFEYAQALSAFDQALKFAPDQFEIFIWKLRTCLSMGKYQEGIQYRIKLLKQVKTSGNFEQQALLINMLGYFYANLGHIYQALDYFHQAWQLSTELGLRTYQSGAIGNYMALCASLGDPEALEYFSQAIQLANETNHPDEVARHNLNIGDFYRNVGDNDKALDFYQNALTIFEDTEPKHTGYIASTLKNMSEVFCISGQFRESLTLLEKAITLAKERNDIFSETDCLLSLGRIYAKTRQFDQALTFYHQALTLSEQTYALLNQANCWNSLGQLYLEMKDHQQASAAFRGALSIGKKLAIEKICWQAEAGLARAAEAGRKYHLARQHYRNALSRIDSSRDRLRIEDLQTSFMASTREIYQRLVELLIKMHRRQPQGGFDRDAFFYAEKARAQTLLSLLHQGQVFQNLTGISEELRLAWLAITTELEQKNKALATELAQPDSQQVLEKRQRLETEIALLHKDQAELQRKIASQYPQYEQLAHPRVFTIANAQKILRPNQVLVAYFVGTENTVVWIVQPRQVHAEIIAANRDHWCQKLSGLSAGLFERVHPPNGQTQVGAVLRDHAWAHIRSDFLHALYRQLFQQPVASHLPANAEIIIAPDDVLCYLPFEMLVTELGADRPAYLIERYPISYVASASCLNPEFVRPGQASKGVLALANPSFSTDKKSGALAYLQQAFTAIFRDEQLLPLPHSEDEARAIARLIPNSEVYLGAQATETVYKARAADFRYLHLATHNLVNDQRPMLSRLVLAPGSDPEDGFLNMYEIFNLKLNAELVVLSACNSGLGKFSSGEGLVGLSRAFQYAGVPSVLASLWWVDDASTALLMQRFYSYLKAGSSKSVALQQAKIDLIRRVDAGMKPAIRNPFYWAPFVLLGR